MVRAVMARATDPAPLRRHFDRSAAWFFRAPRAVHTWQDAGASGLWIQSGTPAVRRVILYFHGGGYICGSAKTHTKLIARLSRMSGIRAYAPDYRLAPEHPMPAALQDAEDAWNYLISKGYLPSDIVLGGDSAGGGLALLLLSRLCQRGTPPAMVFGWSPFCDMTFSGASVVENGKKDHFFPGDRVHVLGEMILAQGDPSDPQVSPLFAQFPECPPVLLQVSDSEIMRDDSYRMADKLREFDARIDLQTWQDAPHVWQMFDGWFPEARAAIGQTSEWINARFSGQAIADRLRDMGA